MKGKLCWNKAVNTNHVGDKTLIIVIYMRLALRCELSCELTETLSTLFCKTFSEII